MERQNYKSSAKQIRLNPELHKKLKVLSAEKGVSVKGLLEEVIEKYLEV